MTTNIPSLPRIILRQAANQQTGAVYTYLVIPAKAGIQREKAIKKWNRVWKSKLIEKNNPTRRELSNEIDESGFPLSRE